jgi:hypothetical protein
MRDLSPWYVARDVMRRAVEDDLLGGAADAVIGESPLDRFIVGILHPRAAAPTLADSESDQVAANAPSDLMQAEVDVPDAAAGGGADAVFDPAVALSRVRYPSSMGMTFAVPSSLAATVVVSVAAARYEEAGDAPVPLADDRVRHRMAAGGSVLWQRVAPEIPAVSVDCADIGIRRVPLVPGLSLTVVVRRPVDQKSSVTVVLVNELQHSDGGRDHLCWFQPQITASTVEGFVDRPTIRPAGVDDEDLDSYDLLFRGVRNLAVGHGCAVDWDDAPAVTQLRTTFVPRFDLRLSDTTSARGLGMSALAASEDFAALRDLHATYVQWIRLQEAQIPILRDNLRATANRHVRDADEAARRIQAGIDLVCSDDTAAHAFRLMNRAMSAQRARQEMIRSGTDAPGATEQVWHPFQIAFVLLNLPGLTSPDSPDRELADLLWFPTGGGKTEAYLGLIAYTMLLRRLRNGSAAGVSVLMRYTLRLLTLQQFERAAGLICALEVIRHDEMPAAAPFSLGLWVGQGAAPNTLKDAQKALRRLRRGEPTEEGNPVQLIRCPWCGRSLSADDYEIDRAMTRMTVHCANTSCAFSSGLPVHLVDEDVYRERPSLIIGTVDKFAMMAWRAEVASLFSTDGRFPPLDLIVQDELHLISGPLGTMVGLYETAVDAACVGEARPKIVASTATIRRARQQVRAVFDRDARQFPPPGLNASDSFFAVESTPEGKGTRQYVGVLAPGVSQATLLVRTYAALLQAGLDLQSTDEVKDAYWTLLGYFNSLRLLGSAFMQVIDDVPDRLKVLAQRAGSPVRELREPRELTSRKKSSEVPTELAVLGTSYPDPESPDVVLATNMISVGVDVDRLGLMAVMGQPQTTAEYIQATSRVGRKVPGLVVVMYNGARSRDLSHYESFAGYHRSLYRQVEATGATPFAARARDRGLHGVVVSLARMLLVQARPDAAAGDARAWETELRTTAERLVQRARSVAPREARAVADQVEGIVDAWLDAVGGGRLDYAGWFDRQDKLLIPAGMLVDDEEPSFPVDLPPWPTLTSLRDVDSESWAYLVPNRRR